MLQGAVRHATLVDESHLIISVRSCRNCQRRYLVAFYELIDWAGGDDSQARVFLPLTEEKEAQIVGLGSPLHESALIGLELSGDQLIWSWPRGQEPYANWFSGRLVRFPHD